MNSIENWDLAKLELGMRVVLELYFENAEGWAPKYDAIVLRGYEAQRIRKAGKR